MDHHPAALTTDAGPIDGPTSLSTGTKMKSRANDNTNWLEGTVPGGSASIQSRQKQSFSRSDLLDCADGRLFGREFASLPCGPLLMIDEITCIRSEGGDFGKGFAKAKVIVGPESWYFEHHFKNDPVMPGSLMIESIWQLAGFYLAWSGLPGRARVLDSGRTRFHSAVSDEQQMLDLQVNIQRVVNKPTTIGIASGTLRSGSRLVCKTDSLKIALVNLN